MAAFTVGAVTIDVAAREARTSRKAVGLTTREASILKLLHGGEWLSGGALADGLGVALTTIYNVMPALKRKLMALTPDDPIIVTNRKRGFQLAAGTTPAPVAPRPTPAAPLRSSPAPFINRVSQPAVRQDTPSRTFDLPPELVAVISAGAQAVGMNPNAFAVSLLELALDLKRPRLKPESERWRGVKPDVAGHILRAAGATGQPLEQLTGTIVALGWECWRDLQIEGGIL